MPTHTLASLSGVTLSCASYYQYSSTHWRRMCECVALHHLSFTHHNGGVCVSAFACVLTALSLVPTPPFTTSVTSATFPVKWKAPKSLKGLYNERKYGPSSQTNASPRLAHTYARCHSLCLAYTNTSLLKLPSARLNDVACYIDAAWCHFSFVKHG